MKTFTAYILGILFALVLSVGSLTTAHEGAMPQYEDSNVSYIESLQLSTSAEAQLQHTAHQLFIGTTSTPSSALTEHTRTLARNTKIGVVSLLTPEFIQRTQPLNISHNWHFRAGKTAPRFGVEYYIYTLRKIII